MSEIEQQSSEPAGPAPDHSLLPPASAQPLGGPPPPPAPPGGAQGFGGPLPSWPPAPPPAPPASNTLWHQIAAAVVIAAVVAAAAGAGIGWSLARTITSRTSTAQTNTQTTTHPVTQPAQPGSPIQPVTPGTGGSLNTDAIAAKIDPAIVNIDTVVGSGQAAGTGLILTSDGEILTNNHVVDRSTSIQVTISGHALPYTAHVIGVDPSADIAVIQVDGDVRAGIDSDHMSGVGQCVPGNGDLNARRAVYYVVVGEDLAVRGEDHPGSRGLTRSHDGVDVDNRRIDLRGDGVVVEAAARTRGDGLNG